MTHQHVKVLMSLSTCGHDGNHPSRAVQFLALHLRLVQGHLDYPAPSACLNIYEHVQAQQSDLCEKPRDTLIDEPTAGVHPAEQTLDNIPGDMAMHVPLNLSADRAASVQMPLNKPEMQCHEK